MTPDGGAAAMPGGATTTNLLRITDPDTPHASNRIANRRHDISFMCFIPQRSPLRLLIRSRERLNLHKREGNFPRPLIAQCIKRR